MTELATLRDFLRYTLSELSQHPVVLGQGTDSLWDEALALVFGSVHLPPDGDDRLLDACLTLAERDRLIRMIQARVEDRMPVAYLVGRAWYGGVPFQVDPRVLIPRSPILECIEAEFSPWFSPPADRPVRWLDLCCGSGCLGILTALAFEESTGVLADLDAGACEVAQSNVRLHGLEDRLEVIQSDCFDALYDDRFDVIVCNPPYVDAEDMDTLPPEFRHEPSRALESGLDGLDLSRRILNQAADWLTTDGVLFLEVGNSWGALDQLIRPRLQHDLNWLAFERGGHGVVVLSRDELDRLYSAF